MKNIRIVSSAIISIFICSTFLACDGKENLSLQNSNTTKAYTTATSPITTVSEKVIPSVVGIVSTTVVNQGYQKKELQSIGSGIIIDSDGYILSNNHVAPKGAVLKISLYDRKDVEGESIWSNEGLDLSIVKIKERNLPAVQLGDSSKVRIGESAIAIGNPLSLKFQRTVTSGIISAINRTIEGEEGSFMEDLIQTDASINPGNSGGPLLNINGEVIGVNSAKIKSAEGIGFAIPINIVKPIIKSLKSTGKFETPVLGIIGFDKEMAGYLDLDFNKGIYIYNMSPNSGAAEVGLKKGDIILSIDGKEVNTMNELREILYNKGVGKTAAVKARTSLGERDFNVKIKSSS